MSTVGAVIDRVMREWLTPPSNMPSQTALTATITNSATSITYDPLLMPEEEARIGAGTIIEIDQEWLRTTDIDTDTRTISVVRGVMGTTAAAHNLGATITLSPRWARRTVFDAVADAVVDLSPELYGVGTVLVSGSNFQDLETARAHTILYARQERFGQWHDVHVDILPGLPELETGMGLQFGFDVDPSSDVWITYAYDFARPTAESTELSSVGVQGDWEELVVLGAVAALVQHPDADKATLDFLTQQVGEQFQRAGSVSELALRFTRLREYKVGRAGDRLKKRYRTPMRMNQVL